MTDSGATVIARRPVRSYTRRISSQNAYPLATMIPFEVVKFGFRIRTRSGSTVDHLSIHGKDLDEATRKLRQMYYSCEILASWTEATQLRAATQSFEDVVDLIVPPR